MYKIKLRKHLFMKSNKIFFIRNQIKKIKFNLRERIFSTKFLYLNLYVNYINKNNSYI